MLLLRMASYVKGIEFYCASMVDDRETWLPTMRTIALEGRCFVLLACQYLTRADYPDGAAAPYATALKRGMHVFRRIAIGANTIKP